MERNELIDTMRIVLTEHYVEQQIKHACQTEEFETMRLWVRSKIANEVRWAERREKAATSAIGALVVGLFASLYWIGKLVLANLDKLMS